MMGQMKWLGLALMMSVVTALQGQINFESTAWKVAAEKAAKNNQLLFVDAYATWCGPCKWMTANVFSDKSVGTYYNANFVNLKLDMETADGKTFGAKYPVRAYPTLMFIDPKGNIVYKVEGSRPVAEFIEEGKKAKAKFTPNNNNNGTKGSTGTDFKINFEKTAWAAAHTKAKGEGKLFFVDAYATWCGPCKWMDKNVFTDASVGQYFNANFINLKLDMESADGKNFGQKYAVSAYPTFLFINETGEVVYKIEGSMPADEFLKEAQLALSKKNANKGGNNNGGSGGSEQPSNDEFNYANEAKTIANNMVDCFGDDFKNIFDKDVLDALEKMLSLESEDKMDNFLENLSEDLQDRMSDQLTEAEDYTTQIAGCLSETTTQVDARMMEDPNFDELLLEEELFKALKSSAKNRAVYLWLRMYAES
jgi:thiol-disulfide isomerase/thioredoxin